MIARHAVRPGRQRARDAVAQHARLAAEEVELVADLQRKQIARVFDRDVFHHLRGRVPAAFDQVVDGVEVALLLRGGGQIPGGVARRACDRNAGRLGAEQVQPRLQRVRHDETGTFGERLVDARDRIVDEEIQFTHRRLIVGQAVPGRSGKLVAAAILEHTHSPLFLFAIS